MSAFLAAHLAASNPNAGADATLAEAIRLAQQPRRPTDLPEYAIGLGWRVQLATGTRVKTGSGDGFESVRSTIFVCTFQCNSNFVWVTLRVIFVFISRVDSNMCLMARRR